MMDGSFNDLLVWKYSRIPQLLGAGLGFDVHTEDELERALLTSRDYRDGFCLLDVHLDPNDRSPALERLTQSLGKKVKAKKGR